MGEVLAIVAAVSFALGSVLQQKGTSETEAGEDDPRFLIQILHKPIWFAGAISQALGWVLQAAALDRASLMVVQALSALSLVIALPLGMWLTHQNIGRRELIGALLTLAGIVFFLSAGQPQGGTSHANAAAWWTSCLVILAMALTLTGVGIRFRGAAKALTFGSAAGLAFGLQAAVTKTFVTEVGSGVLALLASWPVYVLVLSALAGFVLQQSALKTGVLAPALASSNSVSLFVSVVLGIVLFGETISKSGGANVGSAYVGLAVAIGGIAVLAGSKPPSNTTVADATPQPG